MHINISKIDTANLDPNKEIKSDKIFSPRGKSKREFHAQGIFSPQIFGYILQCECGSKLRATNSCPERVCHHCGVTVYATADQSYGWIDLKAPVALRFANYNNLPITSSVAKSIAQYENLIVDGEIIKLDLADEECVKTIINGKDVYTGPQALKYLGVSHDTVEDMFTSVIIVPSPVYRPAILRVSGKSKNMPVINDMNSALINIIKKTNSLSGYLSIDFSGEENAVGNTSLLLATYGATITKAVNEFWDSIMETMTSGRKATVKKELVAGTISNAVRMVLINNAKIDEDNILIGDAAIPTLYPYLWKKHQGDMRAIDEELQNGEIVIANRPPIIGEKSALAFFPRILSVYHGMSINHNGEFFNPELYPETEGIYTCHTNPIVFNGFQADTDGDCFMIFSVFSNEAKNDALKLLPSKNYMDYSTTGIRNSIIPTCYLSIKDKDEKEKTKKKMESWNVTREEQISLYHELSDKLWESEDLPTADDLINFNDKTQERISELTDDDTAETIATQLQSKVEIYPESHSNKFITKVMSANSTDISEAGVFYKNLMASGDDLMLTNETDGITPSRIETKAIIANGEDWYNFNIKGNRVTIAGTTFNLTITYDEFCNIYRNCPKTIEMYTPMNDLHRMINERKLSKLCCGNIPDGIKRIGLYSTLMITERATQSALSNMNKEKLDKENFILDRSTLGEHTEDEVKAWIEDTIALLGNSTVSRRFYEIALISRVRKHPTHKGMYIIKTMKTSINHSGNLFGSFLFRHNEGALKKMINANGFEDNSFKACVAMDVY